MSICCCRLCKQRVYTAGNPQYGQLGHGTDHETNLSHCAHPWSLPDPAVAAVAAAPAQHTSFLLLLHFLCDLSLI